MVDCRCNLRSCDNRFRLVVEGRTAAAAIIVGGPKLDEMTMVASHNLSGINRCERRRHVVWELPERGTLKQKPDDGGFGPSPTMVCAVGLKLRIQANVTLRYSGAISQEKTVIKTG